MTYVYWDDVTTVVRSLVYAGLVTMISLASVGTVKSLVLRPLSQNKSHKQISTTNAPLPPPPPPNTGTESTHKQTNKQTNKKQWL